MTPKPQRKRGAPQGNRNAAKSGPHHERVAVSFSGDLLGDLYDCLALDGEVVSDDPARVRDLVYVIVGTYVRRRKEQAATNDEAIIL